MPKQSVSKRLSLFFSKFLYSIFRWIIWLIFNLLVLTWTIIYLEKFITNQRIIFIYKTLWTRKSLLIFCTKIYFTFVCKIVSFQLNLFSVRIWNRLCWFSTNISQTFAYAFFILENSFFSKTTVSTSKGLRFSCAYIFRYGNSMEKQYRFAERERITKAFSQ